MRNVLKVKLLLLIVLTGVFTLGFVTTRFPESERSLSLRDPIGTDARQQAWADSVLRTLSLEEKIGQLFMYATYSNRNEKYYQDIENLITKYHLGGLIFFQGTAPAQATLTNRYQNAAKVPLMIGIDAEWGLGMRLDNAMSFPKKITLGAIDDDELIERMAYEIGLQCKRLGVHVNFGPVADINTNPDNPVINYRSFGESKDKVASKAIAYARGLRRAGVIAVAKHFPGHGDTDIDSHVSLPTISGSKSRLNEQELVPFKKLIEDGIEGVMTGHLNVPAFEPKNNTPATVSEKIVTDLLQTQLGFEGLIFTDALNMRGITSKYTAGGAEFAAYKAGNDILLQTANLEAGIKKLKEGFESEELDTADLDRRVQKILRAKYRAGLASGNIRVNPANIEKDINNSQAQEIKDQLLKRAVTIVRMETGLIPFIQLDTLTIGSVAVSAQKNNAFQKALNEFGNSVPFDMPVKPGSSADWKHIVDQAEGMDYMVVSVHDMNSLKARNFGVSPSTIDMIKALAKKTKVIVVAFGNPYGLRLFDDFKNVICGFEDDPAAYKAVAEILYGGRTPNGKLPVTASSMARNNTGNFSANLGRLTEDTPESVGMNSKTLQRIDPLIENAISQHAFPGCQILVARRGKVVYHKAFGTFRYLKEEPVTKETIYDLASLTKVSATLQAAMMLYERGLLNLNLKASDYLPELKKTNKEHMTVGDILMHQAGLKAFVPFWTGTKTSAGAFKGAFYETAYSDQNLQVADNLYIKPAIKDSVWQWLIDSELSAKKNRDGSYGYLYSDLGLIMVQRIIEKVTGQDLDKFLKQNLYEPLGMTHTMFNPLDRYPKSLIAPTENEQTFRKKQIWGTVHDPNAALLGGVAGHAGLFSNVWDLAKLYQMNLQKGVYGGRRYLYGETIDHFANSYTSKSHRGIGWNKPDPGTNRSDIASSASPATYGHTGFTGTVVWVDPERQLIFIMLSNRVYPRENNQKINQLEIRRKVHEIINAAVDGV
jgi:beta-N-acetylhexosaminidase